MDLLKLLVMLQRRRRVHAHHAGDEELGADEEEALPALPARGPQEHLQDVDELLDAGLDVDIGDGVLEEELVGGGDELEVVDGDAPRGREDLQHDELDHLAVEALLHVREDAVSPEVVHFPAHRPQVLVHLLVQRQLRRLCAEEGEEERAPPVLLAHDQLHLGRAHVLLAEMPQPCSAHLVTLLPIVEQRQADLRDLSLGYIARSDEDELALGPSPTSLLLLLLLPLAGRRQLEELAEELHLR
mmetsp:Transcript_11225/g.38240  ORF Transcript_11225/g.38240 Transcript_11225/m.38240 type:complete len:243 (-) Transcript_11225:5855-6583(-)